MQSHKTVTRRTAVKSSIFGFLAVAIPSISFAKNIIELDPVLEKPDGLPLRYPSIDDAIVNEVVGVSHFNLKRLKELVDKRPELARATWDWSFGDWETAIGAASHVGRRDIVEYLLSKGARPDIFTYAMLGEYAIVKAMIEARPGIQSIDGPHAISMLAHAKAGLRQKDSLSKQQIKQSNKLIAYEMDLSENTVKIHVRNVIRKLGVTNRTMAALSEMKGVSAPPATDIPH